MSDLTSVLFQCLLIAGLAVILYAVLVRPQQQRLRRHRDMLENLRPGNRIATVGGLVGTIARSTGNDLLAVEIAPGVEIMVTRKSVDTVLGEASRQASAWVGGDRQTAVE